jgi:hypothetical protein
MGVLTVVAAGVIAYFLMGRSGQIRASVPEGPKPAMQQDTGWIDIGSTTETEAQKRQVGSFYKGTSLQTAVAVQERPDTQLDQGGYVLDPAPEEDRSKPYPRHTMSGVWEVLALSDTAETVGTRIPPMTEKGKAMFALTRPGTGPRAFGRDQNDGDSYCDDLGWPRVIYQPIRPVEFFTMNDRQLQHWAYRDQWRTIWTDGRLLPKDPDPLWYGYATGKWVGDVFVADTTGVDDRTWFDRYGTIHSLTMMVQERWRRLDHNTMQLNITIKDPEIYKETWEGNPILLNYYPNLEVDALPCSGTEEFFYLQQMRNFYPKDEDVARPAPKTLQQIVPPVRAPNTGVGLSRTQ